MKKVQLRDKLYSVVSMQEYADHPDLYNPKFTAIENDNAGVVLPIKNSKTDSNEPGIYYQQDSMVYIVDKPSDPEEYSVNKVIDYSKASSIGEIIANNQLIKDIQQDIMATPDNIFYLNIGDDDTPEMKALKTAINNKCVDRRSYEDRFPQYQNDMRLLRGSSITLSKLISICDAFDISANLTLRDKDPDVPNPMGTTLTVDLTERGT